MNTQNKGVYRYNIIHCRDEPGLFIFKKKDKTMVAKKDRVLWADDEIDLLKPHILSCRTRDMK